MGIVCMLIAVLMVHMLVVGLWLMRGCRRSMNAPGCAHLCLGGAQCVVGMVAEKVHEVTTLESSALEDVPTVGTRWPARFVRAIGRRDDRFFIIPDLDAIFAAYLSGEAPAQAHASKDHIE